MPRGGAPARIAVGSTVTSRTLASVAGESVPVPDPHRLVHLQFRRFAGCPVCNLHLRSVVARHDEVVAEGVREVVVFHSSADELRPHAENLPFAVIADPDKRLYVEFGVESGPRALLNPRAWAAILRAILRELVAVLRRRRPAPPVNPPGGALGLPADFLIAGGGRVLAAKYGEHAYDQWSVDELLDIARSARDLLAPTDRPRPGSDAAGGGSQDPVPA